MTSETKPTAQKAAAAAQSAAETATGGAKMAGAEELFAGTEAYGDMMAFAKGNVEALVKSSQIFVKGATELNNLWIGLARTSVEEGVSTAKAMMGCQSFEDVMSVQSGAAKTGYGRLIAEGRKISGLSVKVANETVEPVAERVRSAVETLARPFGR
jgi:phasin family protein